MKIPKPSSYAPKAASSPAAASAPARARNTSQIEDDIKVMRSPEALEAATTGDTVFVRGRPDYRAVIESDCFGRLTVRPLPDQKMSTRARAIWRVSLIEVEMRAAQPSKQEDLVRQAVDESSGQGSCSRAKPARLLY